MQRNYNNHNHHYNKDHDKHSVPRLSGLRVEVGDNFGSALRKFKKKVDDSSILVEYLKRQAYEKPSQKRKRRRGAAIARYQKKLRQKLENQ
jgi:small subunit ribosomal protein S21